MSTLIENQNTQRRALLAERLRKAPEGPPAIPLSFAQQRLWFLDQFVPDSPLYNIPILARIAGPLDVEALQASLDQLLERHEILRTRFVSREGNPAQLVEPEARAKIVECDLGGLPEKKRALEAWSRVRSEVNQPFDLGRAPLLRALLLHLAPGEHWLVLNMHHIVSDEWSIKICFRELGELYTARREGRQPSLPDLPIQYADYALWQRESLRDDILERQLDYWRARLSGDPTVLELPADHRRPATPTFRGASLSRALPTNYSHGLQQLAAGHDSTLFMILLAAFKTLLHRCTQADDLLVGTPIAGRNQVETEGLIGFFVNTLILRSDASGDPPFTEFLRRVRETTLGACAHQDLPFEKLVEKLQPQRTLSPMPFTRVMFAVQTELPEELRWADLTLRFVEPESETAKFDLTFAVQAASENLVVKVEYNRDLFESGTIARLLEHFEVLLGGILADPGRRLSELPLLTAAEEQQLLEWSSAPADYPRDRCIHQLFEEEARRAPNAAALAFENETLSYDRLNRRATRLAQMLQACPAGPGSRVGLCLERSTLMIQAMLGVLKAGAAYVPLDPAQPDERLAFMLADSQARVLLTQKSLRGRFSNLDARMICLDEAKELLAGGDAGGPEAPVPCGPTEPAYVMYTSGSTGLPKGVAVPHRAVVRLVRNTNYVRIRPVDRVAQLSNASFDAATFEIWGALLNGAQLVGITRDVALSPRDFARELREKKISTLFLTTALFNQVAAELPGTFSSVGTVVFGGEAADPKAVRAVLNNHPPRHLVNGYGPTENTTFSACYEICALPEAASSVPIGRPVANSTCYVLDARLKLAPIGVPGELHVGGDGLARGYWNRPELTARKFIANPFHGQPASDKLYKTGDRVRWRPDGTLEFFGRLDRQLKIRGFRVEPGEIEAVLNSHPAVDESVVVARQNEIGQKLLAYYVCKKDPAPEPSELCAFLAQKLPDYMVPSVFLRLERLPLTPNGKVDWRALPEPSPARPVLRQRLAAPRDSIETRLAEIWEDVLGVHPIGIEDKFFDLGGHSLLAVRLVARIEKAFGRRLRVATIFQAPTIEQLAAILREEIQEGNAISGTSLVEIQSQGSRPPLFLVHGAGGGMFWGYVNLARHLGTDQPVYGLKSRGLDGREELGSIEEMAAQYTADIRAFQPQGPYYVGGYCFGGNVAFEIARRLEAQGETVALVALLNCASANSRYDRIRWTPAWALRFLKNLLYWANYFRSWTPSQRREFFRWKKNTFKQQLARLFENERGARKVDAGNFVDLSAYSNEQRRLWETHIRALINYHPGLYGGRVHLFRSPGHPLLCSFDADYGWGDFARGGVNVSIVPGVHEKILEEPCVSVVAKRLNQTLEAARRDAPIRTGPRPGPVPAAAPDPQAARAFWKKYLEGAPALLDLPADRPRPPVLSGARARHPVRLNFSAALQRFCCDRNCEAWLPLLAGFQALLARYSRTADLVTGLLAPGSPNHPVPVRADLSGEPDFSELVRRARQSAGEALAQAAPLEQIREALEMASTAGYAPLFQVLFSCGANAEAACRPVAAAPLDLVLHLEQREADLCGWIEYSTDLFDAERIGRMAGHFQKLLESALQQPGQAIWLLPMLQPAEAKGILIEWNATERELPREATLVQLFEAQVRRTPEAVALVDGQRRLSYRELDRHADSLARRLRALGVGPDVLVGLCAERSWRMIAGMLAVLKAGGAYVPMDPAYPGERLAFMLDDTRAPILLTEPELRGRFAHTHPGLKVIGLDEEDAENQQAPPREAAQPAHLAYVIYTSGSTGKPKGVAIEHRNAVALISWAQGAFSSEELSGVLASTSICFDLSIFELFVPLCRGGKVILAKNALALPGLPAREEVTLINSVPSALRELLRLKAVPASVRVINLAGEPLAPELVDQIYTETSVRKVHDLYGPSETTTYSTYTLRRAGEPATIGKPLANEQVYVLDAHRQPVPVGVPGEIYIGGAGVARGYLNRPELTAEKFVANPFKAGTRLYRTGDLARWRPDGNLEFLGRMDHQVKLRGFRIELGEIESALKAHPALREAVAIVREDQPGDKRLVAYLVARQDPKPRSEELRRFAREALPEYMVPSAFVLLETLPLTANGKVDRKALPAPAAGRANCAAHFVAPRTAAEEKLAAIWREVLGIDQPGVQDNFFELGGHSLMAIQVVSRIRQDFGVEPPLSALFDRPTIGALAEELDSGRWPAWRGGTAELKPVPRSGDMPVSFVQEQLWFFSQMDPGSYAYNMPIAFRLRGRLDPGALQQAADELARRHESLRTTLAYCEGRLKQVIAPPGPLPVRLVRVPEGPDQDKHLRELANAEARQPFDLFTGPLIRMTLLELGQTDHALVVVVHHAIFDGWSWAIFFDELAKLYDAFAAHKPAPVLPQQAVQYADYAHWRRRQMQGAHLERELAHWKEKLKGAAPSIYLPTDRDEPEKLSDRSDRRSIRFSREITETMAALGQREGSSKFMILLGALAATLQQWTRQQDMVIGTVMAGRTRRELEDTIGCFMNFLPLRVQVVGEETGRALLAKVRASVLDAQAHQDCPFEKIVEAVNPERRLNQNPLYNVALLLQNFPSEVFPSRQLQVSPMHVEAHAPLVDLRFEAVEQAGRMNLMAEFNTDIFDGETVEQLLASLQLMLEALTRTPDLRLSELSITEALKEQARRARARMGSHHVVLASTFTAEPVEEALWHWMKELDLPGKISFAPFNQVFQQLLDPLSLMATNPGGLNVALVRLEDWGCAGPDPEDAPDRPPPCPANIERNVRDFAAAIKATSARTAAPLLIILCPASTPVASHPQLAGFLEEMEQLLAGELEPLGGVHVVTTRELRQLYPVTDYYDAGGDELGRVPYTPVFFTALGTIIARKFHALRRAGCKLIALDCDQTLWGGICGEDGPRGIVLDGPRRALQEFMRAQRDAGRLLALCSKNNEEDVIEVFAQRLDMPLRREQFAAQRLNWLPKSQNLKSLAAQLGLGLDSIVFVDDNPLECAEVEANCPGVVSLLLPPEPADIPRFLNHCWVFDHLKLTAEDRRRAAMYGENSQREQLRAQAGTLADFIEGLELKIQIGPMAPGQLARAAQLTQRTNQFNCTTERRTESDIQALCGRAEVLTVSVRDRFGDYGLVGLMICEPGETALKVETFLLSCRALGRGVEHEMLSHLGRLALDRKLRWVNVHFHPSARNKPARDFLEGLGAGFRQALNGGFVFAFPAEFAAEVVFVPVRGEPEEKVSGPEKPPVPDTQARETAPRLSGARCRAIALEADDALKIHQAIESKAGLRAGRQTGVAPQTELQRQLCGIWQKLLRMERVGIRDNFFELGGHSLLAVRLFAEIEKLSGRKLPLVTIFQSPTIEQLARALEESGSARSRSPIVPIKAHGSRPPLFLVHGAGGDVLWGYANLANCMHPDQPIYGIKSRGQVGLEEYDRIEDMARYYVEEIRRVQPGGPYYLGGYCFGGNVAYEMARQLRGQGQEVALVALLDASPCNAGYERICWWRPAYAVRFARNLSYWLVDFAGLDKSERRRYVSRKLRVLGRKLVRRLARSRTNGQVDLEEVIDLSHFPEHELKFWRIHLRAAETHVEQPYEGCVTLIRTRGQPLLCSLEEDFCWTRLARGGVRVNLIPGSHENIFVEPNVKSLAQQLEQSLEQARLGPAPARAAAGQNPAPGQNQSTRRTDNERYTP